MSISFDTIPAALRVPLFYAEVDRSAAGGGQTQPKTLIVGQMTASGSATADSVVSVSSPSAARDLFGAGSVLALMVAKYVENDPDADLWALPVEDNGAGTAGVWTITVTGPATADGTISLYIGGQKVTVAVSEDDVQNDIAAAIEDALDAVVDDLPITATSATNVVTCTAKNDGTVLGDLVIEENYRGLAAGEELPAGVSLAIANSVAGATDPDLTSTLATAIGDEEYDYIVHPYLDDTNLAAFETEMADRWAYDRQIYGHCFTAKRDSVADLTTWGNAQNDPHLTCFGFDALANLTCEIAAAGAGRVAASLRIDPARPCQTLPLMGILPYTAPGDAFTITERNTLLFDGVATVYPSTGYVRLDRAITTYQTDDYGTADASMLDVQTLATLQYILRSLKSVVQTKYGRVKLVDDGTRYGAGQAVVSPSVVRAEMLAHYRELERRALVENFDEFKENLVVERNEDDPNRLDVYYPPDLANQLRVLALRAAFRLQYPTIN